MNNRFLNFAATASFRLSNFRINNLKLTLAIAVWVSSHSGLRAEDWTSSDGVVYKDVKIVKIEADCVTVLDSDGGARIELAKLPAEVQKKLGYDLTAASNAAAKRAVEDKANDVALQKEMNEVAAKKKAQIYNNSAGD